VVVAPRRPAAGRPGGALPRAGRPDVGRRRAHLRPPAALLLGVLRGRLAGTTAGCLAGTSAGSRARPPTTCARSGCRARSGGCSPAGFRESPDTGSETSVTIPVVSPTRACPRTV